MNALLYRVAQAASVRLPSQAAFWLAERLADGWCAMAPRDRRVVQANLEALLGRRLPPSASMVNEVFRHFGRYLVEFLAIHRMAHPRVTLVGEPHLRQAHEARRGVIILSAHVGNWEVGATFLRRMGFPIAAVVLPHRQPDVDRVFTAQRRRCGVDVIPLGKAATAESVARLRRGELLGVLGDWNFADEGIPVTFCRGTRLAPRGPAVLSLRSGAPVVPTALIREGPWAFRFCFDPPIWPPAHGSPARLVETLTQAYATALERYVQRAPEQWLMFQPIHTTDDTESHRSTETA